MVTLANLHRFIEKGHKITVIAPSPFHYYSGMGPGMLGKVYAPQEIRFATQHVVEKQGGRFILDKVFQIHPEDKIVQLASGKTHPYDVISFNTGSYVPQTEITGSGRDIFPVKPIEKLIEAQDRILELAARKTIQVSIIGGGPSAAEIAGNIWRLTKYYGKYLTNIKVFAGNKFMSRFKYDIQQKTARSLTKRGVKILEQGYVKEIANGRIILVSGRSYDTDLVFLALGVTPSPIFKASDLPTGPDGGLLVNEYLQSTGHPDIFGGGDCIHFKNQPLDKVGVYAVRANPILFHNLMASLQGKELQRFDPGGAYLLIFNMGDGTGIFQKGWLLFGGRLAFLIKDYIDRKFMKKFQSIE